MRTLVTLTVRAAAALLVVLAASSASVAQSSRSPEKQALRALDVRQSLFTMINYAYSPMGDMLKNRAPFDVEKVRKGATMLMVLAPVVEDAFRLDTRAFSLKTWASEDIWKNKADFLARNEAFVKASAGLAKAAESADRKAILQAVAEIGRACSACHDDYTR
jgi:cytochrome c556